jgi:hypothetical protein
MAAAIAIVGIIVVVSVEVLRDVAQARRLTHDRGYGPRKDTERDRVCRTDLNA